MKSAINRNDSNDCSGSITGRSRLRTNFLEKERQEISSYVKDLEASLAINKAILNEVLADQPKDSKSTKNSLVKLNEENSQLQKTIKELRKKLEQEMNNNLILEQLLEETRSKSTEQIRDLIEKNNELMEQLKLKEYYLQVFEKKCSSAEYLILKYLRNVPEAAKLVEEINAPVKKGMVISNVVIQNDELKKKIKELAKELNKIRTDNSIQEMRRAKETLKMKINTLTTENEAHKEKLDTQTKMNQELYELNNKLTEQLKTLNNQVSAMMHSKMLSTEVAPHKPKDRAHNSFAATEVRNSHKDFDELSSISSDEDNRKYVMKGELLHKGLAKRSERKAS
eukprot:TRINITY_DN4028_c0_g1_i1.p1 TRINITY_DN4028_c0_g1~~TRINITY_DN4028_c0_g1_i1.p1  ORF type:complete len:339 (+),score=116.59 TRINITY_DN4028_c0_g1_i1:148-1164(+)